MNNEIKEILAYFEEYIKITDMHDSEPMLNWKDLKIVLDYITNLQEENEILKRDIEAMKHNYNLLVRCIENGESMTQKFENGLTYQDYKSRIDKAKEYIKDNCVLSDEWKELDFCNFIPTGRIEYKQLSKAKIKYLLNILQGEDND